jgi:nicotinate-nucleotide adenylyltransferase
MDIGVLGGTFDPVHLGHLIIAEEARLRLRLSQVVFVPAGQPWLKQDSDISPGEHRLEMIRLAIAPNAFFRASTVDLERPGPSYTVDTLAALKRELGQEANLYFILGLDALAGLPTWKEPQKIVELCHLVAAKRRKAMDLDLESLERSIPGISSRVIILDNPLIDISSSEIRHRVAEGKSIHEVVPEAVERYIREEGLYI